MSEAAVRYAVLAAMVIVALLIETVLFRNLTVFSFGPNLTVLIVVAVALLEGPDIGIRYGFAAGLVNDLLGGEVALVGLGAVIMMAVGYGAGIARPYIATSQEFGGVTVVAVAAAAATLASAVLGRIFGVIHPPVLYVATGVTVVTVYSALIAAFVLKPLQGLLQQTPAPRTGRK